ncbi:hypothetical protein CPLU01_11109 [Colletotrichum plurivorum]|uniref:Heterokaryon incompatibility domain-containing protein n=1 Tax=Colletotrichum plurivorum TaxID=2175906 RepID=A0A8H6K3B6_9PEZI|nr:hypothetical protein CPLU01_11109 [Colletotrichum plurivorum]
MAFRPLKHAEKEIRLLRILPGSWNETIKLELDIVSLDAEPKYRALSYAWGNATETRGVTLGGQPFSVTTNLFNALRRLRQSREVLYLWVDAVCIDQGSNKERSEQVSLMGQIYASAAEVIIWLGDTIPGRVSGQPLRVSEGSVDEGREYIWISENVEQLVTSDVFDDTEAEAMAAFSVLHLLADPTTHWDSKKVFAVEEGGGSFVIAQECKLAWNAFMRLMECSWWTRMWVVQEFVLARESRLVVGNAAVPGVLIAGAYRAYSDHLAPGCCCHRPVAWRWNGGVLDQLLKIRHTAWSLNFARNDYHAATRGEEPASSAAAAAHLRKTWWLMRHKVSTDMRDSIYGVLGLVPGAEFFPDYAIDKAEAFSRATEFLISSENNLMALVGPRMRDAGFPSWAPNLISGADDRFYQNTTQRIHLSERFMASKGLRLRHARDGHHLHLWGQRVDTINTVSTPITDRQEAEGLLRWERESGMNSFATLVPSYPAGGLLEDAFWRTIIRDMIISLQEPESVRQATPEDASCYLAFRQWNAEPDSAERSRIASRHPGFEHFRRSFSVATRQQSFFTTARGFFGLAFEPVPGDEVWILAGGTVPFLLRPLPSASGVEGQYNLVGDCFVHGMMYGEEVNSEQPLSHVCLV